MNKRAIMTLGTLLTVASASASTTLPAFAATNTANELHKVTICHANNSATGASGNQPYVRITVDSHSVTHGTGHDDHGGPVATSLAVAQQLKDTHTKWGDIIPPIPADHYPGANWTAEGQVVYSHSCSCLTPTTQVVPATTDNDKDTKETHRTETPRKKTSEHSVVTPKSVTATVVSAPVAPINPTVTELPHTGMSNPLLMTLSLGAITAITTAGGARLRKLFLQQ